MLQFLLLLDLAYGSHQLIGKADLELQGQANAQAIADASRLCISACRWTEWQKVGLWISLPIAQGGHDESRALGITLRFDEVHSIQNKRVQ